MQQTLKQTALSYKQFSRILLRNPTRNETVTRLTAINTADMATYFSIRSISSIRSHFGSSMAEPQAVVDVLGCLQKWRSPTLSHTDSELLSIFSLAEAVKAHLKTKFIRAIQEAEHRPLLCSYSGDGTPVQTKVTKSVAHGSKRCRRAGYTTHEYFVQNLFLLFFVGTTAHVSALFGDPVPMTFGKKIEAAAAIGVHFILDPRRFGHDGPIVRHFAFDRAQFPAAQRFYRQYFTKCATSRSESRSDAMLLYLLDWQVCTPCTLHDVHKSLHWASHEGFSDEASLKNIYISVEALRKSFAQICGNAPRWLWDSIVLEDPENLESASVLQDLWEVLGIAPDLIDDLVSLRLLFRNGKLVVSSDQRGPGLYDRVLFCLFSLWHLRSFNEGRWATVGASCRSMIVARLSGLADLVKYIQKLPDESMYHLNGFFRVGESEMEFIAVVGICSHPTDSVLCNLCQDSRLLKRIEYLEACIADDMAMLAELPEDVWDVIASTCGWPGARLRSSVLAAAHVSVAGMHERFLSVARKLPWSLALGDIMENLIALSNGEEPEEATAAKIWHLMKLGWNRTVLRDAVALLLEIQWATKVAEEQHASAACIAKYHPEMAADAMCARAFLHTVRNLLPGMTELQQHIVKLDRQVESARRRRPECMHGRQVLVKELAELMAVRKSEGHSGAPMTKVVKWAARIWSRMPPGHRLRLETQAGIERAKSRTDLNDRIEDLEQRLSIEKQRLWLEQREDRPKFLMSAVRFDAADFVKIQASLKRDAFAAHGNVRALRDAVKLKESFGQRGNQIRLG